MPSLIHIVETERGEFLNSMCGFSDEVTYHLKTSEAFKDSEHKDRVVTQWLNSVEWGTIPKTFEKILKRYNTCI